MSRVQKENFLTLPRGTGEGIHEEVSCELTFEGFVGVDRPRKALWLRLDHEQSAAMSRCQAGKKEVDEGNLLIALSLESILSLIQ